MRTRSHNRFKCCFTNSKKQSRPLEHRHSILDSDIAYYCFTTIRTGALSSSRKTLLVHWCLSVCHRKLIRCVRLSAHSSRSIQPPVQNTFQNATANGKRKSSSNPDVFRRKSFFELSSVFFEWIETFATLLLIFEISCSSNVASIYSADKFIFQWGAW